MQTVHNPSYPCGCYVVFQTTKDAQSHTFWDAMLTIGHEDRLKGAIVEALSQLEQGYPTAAWQILNDSLKIGGVK